MRRCRIGCSGSSDGIRAQRSEPPAVTEFGDRELNKRGLRAMTPVNGAAVTQAWSAIPGIGLYVSLLHKVFGEQM
jgi:trans-2-enoyl-CoA reductase